MKKEEKIRKDVSKNGKTRGWKHMGTLSNVQLQGKGRDRRLYCPIQNEVIHTFTVSVAI